jgi:hypothetical protein
MSTIRELVDNPHIIHKTYSAYWDFLLLSYEGGIDYCKAFIKQGAGYGNFMDYLTYGIKILLNGNPMSSSAAQSGNLFMHPKEREQDYAERLRMSYYYNFCSPVLDIYSDHMFKQPVNEDFADIDTEVQERYENIDNKQGSVQEFRKEVADMAQLYGHIYVITDSPQYGGIVRTQADIYDNNLLPYFTIHHPQNILNWALDEFGSAYWVLVREMLDGNKDPFAYSKDKNSVVQYRLWTRQEWILYGEDYNEIARGVHGLGVVPITCIFDKQSKKARNFLGVSTLADIAFIARDIYNSCSELKQILRDQTFAFLAIQGNASEYDELSVGTSKGLLYPPDRAMPAYISPPPSNADTYFNHIDRQVSKIFQLAKLEGGSAQAPQQTAVQQSGVSKAWDFNQTNSALSKKAGNLEDGETKLWTIYAKWLDKEFDGSIEYPHEFNVNSLNEDLDAAEKMMRLNLGVDFNKEVKAAIIKKKFPRMAEDDLQSMIDTMETQEDKTAQGISGGIVNRIPSLMNIAAMKANANSSGKMEGSNGTDGNRFVRSNG